MSGHFSALAFLAVALSIVYQIEANKQMRESIEKQENALKQNEIAIQQTKKVLNNKLKQILNKQKVHFNKQKLLNFKLNQSHNKMKL